MRIARLVIRAVVTCFLLYGISDCWAQNTLPIPAPAGSPSAAAAAPRFRRLAPGVETTIPADSTATKQLTIYVEGRPPLRVSGERELEELLKRDPSLSERSAEGIQPAKNVRIVHETWALEFTFKPLRFIRVDVPNDQGLLTSKLIWYLVYHVKNPQPAAAANAAEGEPAAAAGPVRFIPVFWLQSGDSGKLYPDKLIPVAIPAIQRREDPNRQLLNTAEIERELAPGEEIWGVVTWDDIDPSTDRFSILVEGLSGAYESTTAAAGAIQPPVKLKTLQLNFWRPGDQFHEHESEIRYGAPGDVDYRWIYR